MGIRKQKATATELDRLRLAIDYGRAPRTVHSDLLLRGHDEDFWPAPADWPTAELAGSPEKVEVMRLRVEVGQSLWHAHDNRDQVVDPRTTRTPSLRELLVVPVPTGGRKSLP